MPEARETDISGRQARLQEKLRGNVFTLGAREFFTSSIHFPIANLFYEFLLEGIGDVLVKPEVYILMAAAAVQSWALGRWKFLGRPHPLMGNLIGPFVYSATEVIIDGMGVLSLPNHIAYWGFSLAVGLMQALRVHTVGRGRGLVIIAENSVRAMILFGMYMVFEATTAKEAIDVAAFLKDGSHKFILLAIAFGGLATGMADLLASNYLDMLQDTAARLKQYSTWFLGSGVLSAAMEDPEALSIKRQERSILFMDIRGFTAWSEAHSPEEVVGMLNEYFSAAEAAAQQHNPIKSKYTADEVLVFFADPADALRAAVDIREAVGGVLKGQGLKAGMGLHMGMVVEGLIGSSGHKVFDIIGDAVNIASRLCSSATGDEILLSKELVERAGEMVKAGNPRSIAVKGKREPLIVNTLERLA